MTLKAPGLGEALGVPLLAETQTAPRAELLAFSLALESAPAGREFTFVTDRKTMARTWTRRLGCPDPVGVNEDLWTQARHAFQEKGNQGIQVPWFPSHQEEPPRLLNTREEFLFCLRQRLR